MASLTLWSKEDEVLSPCTLSPWPHLILEPGSLLDQDGREPSTICAHACSAEQVLYGDRSGKNGGKIDPKI